MAQNTKIIRELEAARDGLEQKLAESKTALGYKLLEKDDLFVTLAQTREDLNTATTSLEGHQTAISSLNERLAAAKNEKNELEKQLTESCHILGQFLFDNYTDAMASAFGADYEKASAISAAVKKAEEDVSSIEAEISSAAFFKKMTLQMKKSGSQNTVSSGKKKLTKHLDDSACKLVQENLLTADIAGNPWTDAMMLRERSAENDALTAELTAEKFEHEQGKKETKDTVAELEKSLSSQKKQCDQRALEEGSGYVAAYIGADAAILKKFPKTTSGDLNAIHEMVTAICLKNRQIELKELEDMITDCQTQVDKMQSDYENNVKCIAQLQEHNVQVLENIAGTKSLIENYQARMAVLAETTGDAGSEEPAAESADTTAAATPTEE